MNEISDIIDSNIVKIKEHGMDFSVNNARAQKVWCDSENLWLLLTDGRQLSVPLIFFPRLANADARSLYDYELSGGGIAIHWEKIDEDLFVPNLLLGITDVNRLHKPA